MNEVIIYQTTDNQTQVEGAFENDTVWLSQLHMVELFQKNKRTISEHIGNIFKEKELDEFSVVRKFRTTARDGKTYETQHYNLDVIISVGYRVKSKQATLFRQWATQRLKDYLVKGYAINEQKLKASQNQLNTFSLPVGVPTNR